MNREDKIRVILEAFQHMREKTGMYFSTVKMAESYLRGFRTASAICLDLPASMKARVEVVTERGWTSTSQGPWNEMREQGLDDAAIIDEMLSIEIEVWKRAYSDLD